jgi:hypothetical protein
VRRTSTNHLAWFKKVALVGPPRERSRESPDGKAAGPRCELVSLQT